jgi:3-hydroxymyristoyl/3-hydroxydecanoyl-(acyl carrier protein) dehydratase
MGFAYSCIIPDDHPSLEGHFPGNPVVPGVVLLDQVREALRAWQPDQRLASIRQVKFRQVLLPGQRLEIFLEQDAERLHFRGSHDASPILQGEATMEPCLA